MAHKHSAARPAFAGRRCQSGAAGLVRPLLATASLALSLAACTAPVPPAPAAPAPAAPTPGEVHSFTIDRAYSLTDPRELAFRDQIAEAAAQVCGTAGFSLYSSRPIGSEEVREDFLYRLHEVQITCDI